MGFALKSSHLLGRYPTTWTISPAHFCFSYFLGIVSYFLPRLASDHNLPSYIAGITVLHHYTLAYWFFPGLATNWDPPYLCLLSSWDYRHELLFLASWCIIIIIDTGAWTQGLYLEPLHQPFFVMGFFDLGSLKLFAIVTLKSNLPDLCLLSS
jgi:hypothetical protein